MKLVELKDAQEDAVRLEDFMKAQDLKGDISDVQDRIQELKASLMDTLPANGSCDLMSDDGDDTMSMLSQEEGQTEEVSPRAYLGLTLIPNSSPPKGS